MGSIMLDRLSAIMNGIGQARALRTDFKNSDDQKERNLYVELIELASLWVQLKKKELTEALNPVDQG